MILTIYKPESLSNAQSMKNVIEKFSRGFLPFFSTICWFSQEKEQVATTEDRFSQPHNIAGILLFAGDDQHPEGPIIGKQTENNLQRILANSDDPPFTQSLESTHERAWIYPDNKFQESEAVGAWLKCVMSLTTVD